MVLRGKDRPVHLIGPGTILGLSCCSTQRRQQTTQGNYITTLTHQAWP